MKYKFLIILIFFLGKWCGMIAQKVYLGNDIIDLPQHPRILLPGGDEKSLKKNIMKDVIWKDLHQSLLEEASLILAQPLNERIIIGWRLLDTSRENLRRIFTLSYAYRMTRNISYMKRAEAEMLKAASFPDWNPQHFLDVAEMTMALAIGYDWLYDELSINSRKIIEDAIIQKGLKPSFNKEYNWFVDAVNNWNQVCHTGVTYGALAIWEKNKDLARETINRAIEKIQYPMQHYAPDGAYPEGVIYWDYGTSFNALFLSAVEEVFNTSFGLEDMPGFLKSGEYNLHAVTPGLKNFNYSDNGENAVFMPAAFWFSRKTKNASLLYNQLRLYRHKGWGQLQKHRLAPVLLIWGNSISLANVPAPKSLFWKAQGDNPICTMRSSWNDSLAVFVGMKMGSPAVNHGHMDIGSFFFEANGVVWGMDLGADDYDRLEKAGVDLWNKTQNSQRWDAFRYSNKAHNTLTFNGKKQCVDGKAQIDAYSDKKDSMYVSSDLTSVYADQVESVKRSVALVNKKYAVVEDVIVTGSNFTNLRWTMMTAASVKVISDKMLCLEKDGKRMFMKVESAEDFKWNIIPAEPEYSYDSPNPGITVVGLDMDLKLNERHKIKVYLSPD